MIERAAALREALPEGGVLLGLDPGSKTIGTALCDAGWRFSTAHRPVPRTRFARDAEAIGAIVADRAVAGLVVGLPRNMDGSEGPAAQSARAFAANLATRLELPALLWDERWSTIAAQRDMIAQGASRAKQAKRIDSHAAAVILQSAIDALTGGTF